MADLMHAYDDPVDVILQLRETDCALQESLLSSLTITVDIVITGVLKAHVIAVQRDHTHRASFERVPHTTQRWVAPLSRTAKRV